MELFAEHHPDISHTPGVASSNKRFFNVRSLGAVPEFSSRLPLNASPCIMFDLQHDARYVSEGKKEVTYTAYFCARGGTGKPNEEELAAMAITQTEELIEDFRRYVIKKQEEADPDYASIDLDFSTYPYGPLMGGWYATAVTINKIESVRLC